MSNSRLYVGGLPYDVRQRDVEDFFQGYGRIEYVQLMNGFCFVKLSDPRDADDAIKNLDNRRILGKRVVVQLAHRGEQNFNRGRLPQRDHRFSQAKRTNFRVTVENLSSHISWKDLKDFFRKTAKVTYARAHNLWRNQAMAEFETYDDMKRVVNELNGTELNGRKIIIKEAASSSRSRSRSPIDRPTSLSRSRSPVKRSIAAEERIRNLARSRSLSPFGRPKFSRSRSRVTRSISADEENKNLRKRSREHSAEASGTELKCFKKFCK